MDWVGAAGQVFRAGFSRPDPGRLFLDPSPLRFQAMTWLRGWLETLGFDQWQGRQTKHQKSDGEEDSKTFFSKRSS